jgi:hypothetical protein
MSEKPEEASEKIEMFPIGYVENDYLEPEYNEEIYRKVSKIVLKMERSREFLPVEAHIGQTE